jgi:hypothetical protein
MRARSIVFIAAAAAGCSSTANGASTASGPPASWRRAVLVELFTSQGCSSCPPADAFVRDLPALGLSRDKVIPLTFHVDYWDGLGWKDPFASGAFTERQRWYAGSSKLRSPDGEAGLDGLYTPQMIVDGKVQFSGQRRQTAVHEMERGAARPLLFDLAVRAAVKMSALELTIQATPVGDPGRDRDWRIIAALVAKKTHTAVARGENAGEQLEEASVVRALSDRLAMPPPRSVAHVQISKPADLAWADIELIVFAQSEASREIGGVRAFEAAQLGLK